MVEKGVIRGLKDNNIKDKMEHRAKPFAFISPGNCNNAILQGEYIAPEKIELIYDRCTLVGQVLVYGNSLKSNLVAIIIPDELSAMAWAKANGLEDKTFIEVCQSKALNEEILKQVSFQIE